MILYEGKSMLDGKPIVAIATIGSSNVKTGDMAQIWILRSDISPTDAVKSGADSSICGDCPQRHFLGGACYVTVFQAPLSVYKAYKRGSYSDPKHIAKVTHALAHLPIRFGAYGDPAAVPFAVWGSLNVNSCGKWTGYTHQWKQAHAQPLKALVMASCDNPTEAELARAKGWRYFLVTADGPPSLTGSVECLSDAKDLSCADCGICDGTRFAEESKRVSVWIAVHGARSKRFALPTVR